MWAGAISELYSVTATEAKATAMPSSTRPRMSTHSDQAAVMKTTPISNSMPAISMVNLRP